MKNNSKRNGYLIVAAFWLAVLILWSTNSQAQTQIDNCDSLGWSQYPVSGLSITLDTTGAGTSPHGVDSVEVIWTACNTTTCYSAPMGMTGYFPQVSLSDTLKVCFDAWFYSSTPAGQVFWEFCSQCDSIIHDGTSWVLFNASNPVGIVELMKKEGHGKMYDLFGRELINAPIGTMYIRNNKKYIRVINNEKR
jgi:hypothetical protein